jgi:hypothetical protein
MLEAIFWMITCFMVIIVIYISLGTISTMVLFNMDFRSALEFITKELMFWRK